MMMIPKAKKEAPVPPKAETKAKALKAKRAVLKGIHSHTQKEEDPTSPTFQRPKTLRLFFRRAHPGETSVTTRP